MLRRLLLAGPLLAVGLSASAQTNPPLKIVSTGPTGEVASLAEANEIRVVFSEPMVGLGRVPQPVQAPFFHIRPRVAGAFRWSGTTILIFTPDPRTPLPYATDFDVTIDRTATAVSGRTLGEEVTFRFTTPTVKLLAVDSYRRDRRYDRPLVVLLRFNQPVRPPDVLAHVRAQYSPHEWSAPDVSEGATARLAKVDPSGLARFRAKVAAATAAAGSSARIGLRVTTEWDTKQFEPGPDLVVLETLVVPPPESLLAITLDTTLRSAQGRATPGVEQGGTVDPGHAFFVRGVTCTTGCTPADYNPIGLTAPARAEAVRGGVRVTDITNPAKPVVVQPTDEPAESEEWRYESDAFTLEDLRFPEQPPVRTYEVRLDASVTAVDGQPLGYPWLGTIENWHERAFSSFGDGHGVWEASGGPELPFHARNLRQVTQWALPLAATDLMPRLLELQRQEFRVTPGTPGLVRPLRVVPDQVQSYGLDVSRALNAGGHGLAWAAVEDGPPIERSRPFSTDGSAKESSIVQVTNLGITVKDSPDNTLVFVTRLDTGAPAGGVHVSIVRTDNRTFWTGVTDDDGIAIAPDTRLRNGNNPWDLAFLVIAEKDGDVAYVGSDWIEGITPYDFGFDMNPADAGLLLRGTVFSDRGVYRLGEEVHFKAILRTDTARGIRLLPAATPVYISLRDSEDREVDRRVVPASDWSSLEWTFRLPGDGALGTYTVQAQLEDPAKSRAKDEADAPLDGPPVVSGSFLVAAYRRPDFRVDVAVDAGAALAGDPVGGTISAHYLFGATMGARPVRWTITRSRVLSAPPAVLDRFVPEQWAFVGSPDERGPSEEKVAGDEATLRSAGDLTVSVPTGRGDGVPYRYTVEGEVEDVSRQRIANRASRLVHPAPWYIGVRRPPYFTEQGKGLDTALVAVDPAGTRVGGVTITVSLAQVQWHSARQAEGGGFYQWASERREVPAGSWTVTSAADPVPLAIPLPAGGSYVLSARAEDADGRSTTTVVAFYALGEGYTAWARYDHNRIDLVPERQAYKPGDTARVMIQSPWERATALVTTEREGIRTHRRFTLTSTHETIPVPITEADIPNVFVSVLLVKGRTRIDAPDDGSDPGKPTFRLGYVELRVDDATKRLTTTVVSNAQEYRPANKARIDVEVKDGEGRPVRSEVTLWAVDYGVLSLTNFQTPDVLGSVYVRKALQVLTEDNRQRIVSRRAIVPKGTDEGGGGGQDTGEMRRDFRVLAFWIGSAVTEANGRATVNVTLPESLTTYRIMAVSGDRASRFGWGQGDIRVNKPVTLRPAFPRFLAVGDRGTFGSLVTSQLARAGDATVTLRSLDPGVLRIGGDARRTLRVAAGGTAEVAFEVEARAVGRARLQTTVTLNGETDAYEEVVPVEVLTTPETVAVDGETGETATETLIVPAGVVPGTGGLRLELASTAMAGLGEGASYLVEYPYGCAEQKGSRALALLLAADLGQAFALPGIDAAGLRPRVQTTLNELRAFQCPSGGFAFWPGECVTASPYLTSNLLHVLDRAVALGFAVDGPMRSRAYDYLEKELGQPPPSGEGSWPAYGAWQAFAAKVLADGGRNQDSTVNRLMTRVDRMPVFGLVHLYDALSTAHQEDPRRAELRRRIENAILPEGGSAHVEELNDPYLGWFWSSNVRSTAIALDALVRHADGDSARIRPIVRWLVAARRKGRWGNTQENAWALEALVRYYRAFEATAPDFTATVALGGRALARETFAGRSTPARTREIPLPALTAGAAPGTSQPLTFRKQGSGTLFYAARLRYALNQAFGAGVDQGFAIDRSWAPYVENGAAPATSAFKAGDLVRVTLTLRLPKERRYVAVTDPLPAGFEPVESWFATTARDLAKAQDDQDESEPQARRWWWERGGFDHVERHDNRVLLFGTRLAEGEHVFSYIVRATTPGTFRTAPAHAEEMYDPEVFGRSASAVIEVRR